MAGRHSLNLKQGPRPRNPRHPTRIREGQVFFPRQGERRLRATVKRVEGESIRVVREDGTEISLALDRLLARDGEGNGRYFRFLGWKSRPRGYRTELRVAGVFPDTGRCALVLPEWDPATKIEETLEVLPGKLREVGAVGSCMADLASPTASRLGLHSCRPSKARGGSRTEIGVHPDFVAAGQRYRRRGGRELRVLKVVSPRVRAWNGNRVIWLSEDRLLAVRADGIGRYYEYRGGGVWQTRRERHEERSAAASRSGGR